MVMWNKGAPDRRWLMRASALLGAGLAAEPAYADTGVGLVTSLRGDVVAELKEVKRALSTEGPVFVGDRIDTGVRARVRMKLGQSTELRLGEQTRITIDRFIADAGGIISLGAGAMLFDKDPASSEQAVRVRSPYGLIAVRGTSYFAGPSNGVFGVFVARGRVSVQAAGKDVLLETGQGTDIARPGAPPSDARDWGLARIEAALALVW
jgi:ferric-dicitrate binding protein FerR (iron transport regulator)